MYTHAAYEPMSRHHQVSRHAAKRMQQRVIPPCIVDMLVDYGTYERSHDSSVVKANRQCEKVLREEFGAKIFGTLKHYLNVRLVVAPDRTLITAMWKH